MENPIAILEEHAQKKGLSLDEWIGSIRRQMGEKGQFPIAPGGREISKAENRVESLKYRQWVLQKMPPVEGSESIGI